MFKLTVFNSIKYSFNKKTWVTDLAILSCQMPPTVTICPRTQGCERRHKYTIFNNVFGVDIREAVLYQIGCFLDALASLETTQVSQSVGKPQFRQSHNAAL